MIKKHPKANLRSLHLIFTEIGLILSLLVMIAATNARLESAPAKPVTFICDDCDIVPIELPPTTIEKIPPAPMRPQVPIEVIDSEIIDDIIDLPTFDTDLLDIPLPPPPKEEEANEIVDYYGVEIKPVMKGGMQQFYAELNYPKLAQQAGIEGLVTVQFVIDKQGNPTNINIVRGIGGGCDEEVLRVLKRTTFSPAIQNGRFVPVKMTQNVRFTLQK